MARNIKGITIEIGGDTTKLEKALKDVNKTSREVNRELREINTSLRFNPGNTELLAQKQRALGDAIENTKKKLEQLKLAQEQASKALKNGEIGQAEYDALVREIIKTENQLKSLEGQANQTAQTLKRVSEGFMSAGEKLSAAGDKMTKNVTVPLTALGTLATKSAVDFDSAMIGVRKTTELTDKEFADMTQTIRDMSKTMPSTAVEIAGVAEAAGQLGIEKENITKFAQVMIDLGETTNLTADEAANAFARFANITQMPQTEFENLASTVVELGNNMATTEAEITAMGLRLAATGKQVGFSEAEIMGLAAAMSSVGIEAEAGGSAMSTTMKKINTAVLGSMGKVNEELEHFTKIFANSGVTIEEVMVAYKQGDEALQSLANTLGGTWDISSLQEVAEQFEAAQQGVQGFAEVAGMSADEFTRMWKEKPTEALTAFIQGLQEIVDSGGDVNSVLKELGISGIRETDTLSRLAGAGDLLTDSFNMANDAFKENTALSEEAQLRYESVGAKFEIFRNKLTDVAITIGNVLLPAISDVITYIGNLADKISNADPNLIKLGVTIAAIAAAIGPVLKVLGGFATLIGTVTGALAVMGGATVTTTPLMLGLVAVFTKLSAIGPLVSGALATIGTIIGISAGAVGVAIAGIIAAGVLLYQNWDTVKEKAVEIWGNISEYFSGVWEGVSESWTVAWEEITSNLTEMWSSFIESVGPIWETLKNVFEFVWLAIQEVFNIAWLAISTPLILAWEILVATAETIFLLLVEVFASIWESISAGVSTAWESIKTTLTSIWQSISTAAEPYFTAIKTAITNVWNNIKSTTDTIWNGIKSGLDSIWNSIKSAVDPIFNNIKTAVETVWNAIKSKTTEVWNSIKSALETAWNGLKDKASEVFNALKSKVEEVWNGTKSKTDEVWDSLKSSLESIWNGIKSTASTTFDSIKSKIDEVWNAVKSATTSAWEAVKKAIETPINAARDAVNSAIERIKSILSITLPFPKIKLPHFRISGSFSLNPPSVPSFGVDWYDKGGIFTGPTIIGVGEKRPEFVGALDDLKAIVAEVINKEGGNNSGGVLITGNNFYVRDDNDIKKIAEELNKLQQQTNRGRGMVTI